MGDWRDNARHDQRDCNGEVSRFTFPRWDMKCGRQGRAECKAEKQSNPNSNNSSEDPEENRAH
jgi:hypothetical protein